MFIGIISQYFLNFAKKPSSLLIIALVLVSISFIGVVTYYHFNAISLENQILTVKLELTKSQENYKNAKLANDGNLLTITELKKEIQDKDNSNTTQLSIKDNTISSLKKLLSDTKPVQYQSTYTYKDCKFNVKGDSNESSELFGVINSIGF